MNRTTILFLSILLLGVTFAYSGHTAECPLYTRLAKEFMPEAVGNERVLDELLQVEPDNWMSRLNLEELLRILNDDGLLKKGGVAPKTLAGMIAGEDSFLKFNLTKGEMRYANRSRLFTPDNPKAIDPEKGIQIVLSLLSALGFNEQNVSIRSIQDRVLKGAVAEPKQVDPKIIIDMERTYFVPRIVKTLAVSDSIITVGLSNDGLISRFRVRWPLLVIDQRISKAKVVSQEEMIFRVSTQMETEQGCQKNLEKFAMRLAYAPIRGIDGDDKDNVQDVNRIVLFAPKLIVQYLPGSLEEGGNVSEFYLYALP